MTCNRRPPGLYLGGRAIVTVVFQVKCRSFSFLLIKSISSASKFGITLPWVCY
jgi:hypothetical protein